MHLPETAAQAARWFLLVGLAFYAADATSALIGRRLSTPQIPLPKAVIVAALGDTQGQAAPPGLIRLLQTTSPKGGLKGDSESASEEEPNQTVSTASPVGQLRLQGTLAASSGMGLAIFDHQGTSRVISSGEQIAGFTLTSVTSFSATLENQGRTFLLELDSKGEGPPTLISQQPEPRQNVDPAPSTEASEPEPSDASTEPIRSTSELTEILDNPESFMQGLAAKPEVVGDEVRGIRIQLDSPSHPLARLGIANGDLVKSLNGTPLEGPESLTEVYRTLRNTSELNFEVERNGRSETVNLSLE